ncbi:ras-related protein Rab-42-like [Ambystoma mexicanum]|uniref:ras-related protein Rab-42-like n=1 Tax=Ambystoma mexicanum TaxID=8296 RepID=UPI0037E8839B
MPRSEWHYQFRVIMLGEAAAGKTSLLRRYTEDVFEEKPVCTVGVEFYTKMLKLEPGVRVKLQVWDTAGEERFRCITRSFYRNAIGVLLVFDRTKRSTFLRLDDWYMEAQDVLSQRAIFILVGQKSDQDAPYKVPTEEAAAWAKSLGMSYVETSAKSNFNVDHVFRTLATTIYDAVTCEAVDSGEVAPPEGWEGVKVVYRCHSFAPKKVKPESKCQC